MAVESKPSSFETNRRLWGAHASDWAEFQEITAQPVYDAILERTGVGPATRFLDIGCGAGLMLQMAAARGAKVSAVDASDALLYLARSRVDDGDIRQCDLEQLPFPDRTFDVVSGFNAFQYAGNPIVALAEAGRVCRSDGAVVVVTWGDPDRMEATVLIGALRALVPPAPGAPGPFALSDEATLRQFAVEAGLDPVEIFDVDSPFLYDDEVAALRGWNSSGNAARMMEATSEAAVSEVHAAALEAFRQPDGSVHISATYRCLLARPSQPST